GYLGHDRRGYGQHLGCDRRRADHRHRRGPLGRLRGRQLRRHFGVRSVVVDPVRAADRAVRRPSCGTRRHMSGYLEGILVLLAVNVVFVYGAFLPVAAGQLNLGLAGFAAIGAYASAYLSNTYAIDPTLAIPLGGIAAGGIALVVAVPVLRTRGIYLALA